jgi:hypothetical protein
LLPPGQQNQDDCLQLRTGGKNIRYIHQKDGNIYHQLLQNADFHSIKTAKALIT